MTLVDCFRSRLPARVAVWVAGFCVAASQAEVERHPISAGTAIDFGRIVSGKYENPVDSVADGQTLTRTGVYLTESGTLNKRLSLYVTVGGLFWWPLPEGKEFHQRVIRFGPGVGQAQALYRFGENPEEPFASLQFGLFPIKYNPDSKNLGEYLYRSGTYPGILYSGGWSYLNATGYLANGLKLSVSQLGGSLVHDFSLTLERDMEPTNNLSPAYLFTWKPAKSLEIGGGMIWAHGLQLRNDSIVSRRTGKNAYVKATGLPLSYDDVAGETDKKHYASNDPRVKPDGDPCLSEQIDTDGDGTPDAPNPCFSPAFVSATANGIPAEQLGFYTFRGFKTMARASLDLGTWFGLDANAFKFYGEWALLGLQDQPFFYEDRTERMPVMFGVNLPTLGFLDVLGLEVEYRKSRFPNSIRNVFNSLYPVPVEDAAGGDYSYYDLDSRRYTDTTHAKFLWLPEDVNHSNPLGYRNKMEEEFRKDDWKWSVFARKTVTQGLTVYAQAASDHFRQIDASVRPMFFPTTQRVGDWYYIVRLEMGI